MKRRTRGTAAAEAQPWREACVFLVRRSAPTAVPGGHASARLGASWRAPAGLETPVYGNRPCLRPRNTTCALLLLLLFLTTAGCDSRASSSFDASPQALILISSYRGPQLLWQRALIGFVVGARRFLTARPALTLGTSNRWGCLIDCTLFLLRGDATPPTLMIPACTARYALRLMLLSCIFNSKKYSPTTWGSRRKRGNERKQGSASLYRVSARLYHSPKPHKSTRI